MQVKSTRVQNFRCIRDSGDVLFTSDLTILIGENESGKTALLDALYCFNRGQEFFNSDLSTMSPERESVLSGIMGKETVDMVTVTFEMTDGEIELLNIPRDILPGDFLVITKRLDNSYVIKGPNGTPLSELYASIKNNRLLTEVRGIRRQLGSVYQGSIVRKLPQDQFVFLRRSDMEPESANLILFQTEAGAVWEDLRQSDVVQVTQQAPDPFERNARAMNVGKAVDLDDELNTVEKTATSDPEGFDTAVNQLLTRIRAIPPSHPLRSIISDDFEDLLERQINANSDEAPWDDDHILDELPIFERGLLSTVDDKLPLNMQDDSQVSGEVYGGLQALVDEVGLDPSDAVLAEPTERIRIFDEKSRLLSEIFTASWVREVEAEFVPFNQDRELGLAISCQGSLDPPSRRSQGFNTYLGLTASLLEIARRSHGKLVLLLDDPAMHLHPTAQEKLADVLGKQQFQVLAATHFSFMISPKRLDRVRLLCRTETGAYLEEDWKQAGAGMLPIRGGLSRWTLGRIPLLVEGDTDRQVLVDMSELLGNSTKDTLSPIMEPLPSGGSAMPHAAKALRAMDVKFIALVDGDQQGDDIKRRLMREVSQPDTGVTSLRDIVTGTNVPTIEHLFSQSLRQTDVWNEQGLKGLLRELQGGQMSLDKESEDNLTWLFQFLNESLEGELKRT